MDRDDAEAIEVFLRREDAEDALVVLLRDEPTWEPDLSIVEIEIDEPPDLGELGPAIPGEESQLPGSIDVF
jgi:hypothetical protein